MFHLDVRVEVRRLGEGRFAVGTVVHRFLVRGHDVPLQDILPVELLVALQAK